MSNQIVDVTVQALLASGSPSYKAEVELAEIEKNGKLTGHDKRILLNLQSREEEGELKIPVVETLKGSKIKET